MADDIDLTQTKIDVAVLQESHSNMNQRLSRVEKLCWAILLMLLSPKAMGAISLIKAATAATR